MGRTLTLYVCSVPSLIPLAPHILSTTYEQGVTLEHGWVWQKIYKQKCLTRFDIFSSLPYPAALLLLNHIRIISGNGRSYEFTFCWVLQRSGLTHSPCPVHQIYSNGTQSNTVNSVIGSQLLN